MKVKDVLLKAKSLIADPAHWTQGVYARDAEGFDVGPNSPTAVCWCSYGAIDATAPDFTAENTAAGTFLKDAALALFPTSVPWRADAPFNVYGPVDVNDKMTHADVMRMFDKAAELAGEDNA